MADGVTTMELPIIQNQESSTVFCVRDTLNTLFREYNIAGIFHKTESMSGVGEYIHVLLYTHLLL